MKVLVAMPRGDTRDSFIPPEALAALAALGEVAWNELDRNYPEAELRAALAGVVVCVTGWGAPRFTPWVLAGADQLRLIAHTGGSVAPIASEAVYARGILVISGNDVFARSVAEGVVAYALAALREIPKYARMVQERGWSEPGWRNEGLLDQSVGLVGFGAVARHTAVLLRAFDARLAICADHVTPAEAAAYGARKLDLGPLFRECKIISIHLAATPETFHQIDGALLASIQDGALLINTARGRVIDEAALARELRKGRFKAVLDVYEQEPLPMDSPLRGLPNALLMPHMGGPTMDRRPLVTRALIEEIPRVLAGEPSRLLIPVDAFRRMTQ